MCTIAVIIAVEHAVKCSFVLKGMQTRRKGQYNAELTLMPRLCDSVKPLRTTITAIDEHTIMYISGFGPY